MGLCFEDDCPLCERECREWTKEEKEKFEITMHKYEENRRIRNIPAALAMKKKVDEINMKNKEFWRNQNEYF